MGEGHAFGKGVGRGQGSVWAPEGLSFCSPGLLHCETFPKRCSRPYLVPHPAGTTSHANDGSRWRRMMASCPGSCCRWTSPMCYQARMRREGEVVTATHSTAWPWSRKVSSTRAGFFPLTPSLLPLPHPQPPSPFSLWALGISFSGSVSVRPSHSSMARVGR